MDTDQYQQAKDPTFNKSIFSNGNPNPHWQLFYETKCFFAAAGKCRDFGTICMGSLPILKICCLLILNIKDGLPELTDGVSLEPQSMSQNIL